MTNGNNNTTRLVHCGTQSAEYALQMPYQNNAIQSCTKSLDKSYTQSMQLSFIGYTSPFSVGGCPASIKIIATVYVQRLSYSLL